MGRRELAAETVVHQRYRVESVLGSGGFGITYRVMDLKYGRIAAMKEYMPLDAACRAAGGKTVRPVSQDRYAQYEKFRQQFLKEAQTIHRFRGHPNIVDVYHLFLENNTAYYVMEYLDGMDLKRFLASQGGRISWDMLYPIAAQVVSALKTVHSGNMIHCDVSPANIRLMRGGRVKLLDFGAAKEMLRGSVVASVIVANMGYAPCEQLWGKKLGPWTDVYALAATMYHCITGVLPPKAEERMERDSILRPSQMGISVPSEAWENALMKGLAVRVEHRWGSIMDFWEGLTSRSGVPGPLDRTHSDFHPEPVCPSGREPMLHCARGILAGLAVPVEQEIYLGTDAARCRILFPQGTPGVSRIHLRFWPDEGRLMAMDMGSRYGSWLGEKKMMPGLAYRMTPGALLSLGQGQVFLGEESSWTDGKRSMV